MAGFEFTWPPTPYYFAKSGYQRLFSYGFARVEGKKAALVYQDGLPENLNVNFILRPLQTQRR